MNNMKDSDDGQRDSPNALISAQEKDKNTKLFPVNADKEIVAHNDNDEIKFKHTIIKVIFLTLFVIISIVAELFYRDSLYQYSLQFEKSWQQSSLKSTITFFKIVTNLGGGYFLVLYVLIAYFFFPLTSAFTLIVGLVSCNYLDNVMKLLYHNPRPYWSDSTLFMNSCDGGFGNPSGHSFSSTFTYFGFFQLLAQTNFFSRSIIFQIILGVLAVMLVIIIVLSRIILGMHSINQIIYGCSLGISVYYFLFHILFMHEMKTQTYVRLFNDTKNILTFSFIFLIGIIVLLLSYFMIDFKVILNSYESILLSTCPEFKEEKLYRKFENDGFFGGLTLFCLMGTYYGQCLFWYLIHRKYGSSKDEKINKWVENRRHLLSFCDIIKIILIYIACAIPMIAYFLINKPLWLVFIFKVSIPFFLTLFFIFGPGQYFLIYLGLCNSEIFSINQRANEIDSLV